MNCTLSWSLNISRATLDPLRAAFYEMLSIFNELFPPSLMSSSPHSFWAALHCPWAALHSSWATLRPSWAALLSLRAALHSSWAAFYSLMSCSPSLLSCSPSSWAALHPHELLSTSLMTYELHSIPHELLYPSVLLQLRSGPMSSFNW